MAKKVPKKGGQSPPSLKQNRVIVTFWCWEVKAIENKSNFVQTANCHYANLPNKPPLHYVSLWYSTNKQYASIPIFLFKIVTSYKTSFTNIPVKNPSRPATTLQQIIYLLRRQL